ncbi:MAG: ABC transporter ATP-binding protein [Roseburia sp.]|nr:ABC transporter ATP-binding protein [Roseburia sp.]
MLEFSHVSVSCGHTPILKDISVSFPSGQITTLIGPNGCGKTTLLQCLNGVSKVTAGTIRLNGENYLKLPPKERAKKLAFLPQVRTIIPALPTKTLVEHGRFPHLGFSRKKSVKDVEIVSRAMEFTHVTEYADCSVDTLSGGMRQRVFFAMVLAQDCDYIVLDEPTTYLDISGQREFLEMVCTLKEQGKTVILILHDLNQALRISDRLLVMNDRKIKAAGTPEDCLASGVIEEVFQTQIRTFTDGEERFYFFR